MAQSLKCESTTVHSQHSSPSLPSSTDASRRPDPIQGPTPTPMPMIDVYATTGTFDDTKALTQQLAAALMRVEQVPDISLFRQNTAAFMHELPPRALPNVDADTDHVPIHAPPNARAPAPHN